MRGMTLRLLLACALVPFFLPGGGRVSASSLQDNLMSLYGGNTLSTAQPVSATPSESRSYQRQDIDDIPDFAKSFTDQDYAIVVGIEDYKDLPGVEFSFNDARLFRDYLVALGLPERNITYLTNRDATFSAIRIAVERWLPNNLRAGGQAIFYYSGHGSPEPASGDAYLVPYDGDPAYLKDSSYSLKQLYAKLGELPASKVLVLMDACFSGIGGRSVLAKGVRSITMKAKAEPVTSNMIILAGADKSQIATSYPEKEHGLFTYYFLEALQNGQQSIADIYQYLKPRVEDGAKKQNVNQTPIRVVAANGGTDMTFATNNSGEK